MAIFRQVDDAGSAGGGGRALETVAAVEAQRARSFSQAGEDLGELALAVAVDAGDAEDFATADVEGEAAQGRAGSVRKTSEINGFQENVRPA